MDGDAHFFGEADEEANIVDGEESGAEGLAAFDEVMEVGTSVVLTSVTVTIGFDWGEIISKSGVFEIDAFFFGVALRCLADTPDESIAVTGESSRGDAVEDVDSARYAFNEVDWLADAHEVA